MSKGKGKKLVYVSEDLIEELIKISSSKGESIGKFIEDSLRQILRVSEIGYDSKQLADFFEVMQAQRILGGAFVPLDVLNFLTGRAYNAEKEQLEKKWFEGGRWHGKYLKEKFDDPLQAFKVFLGISRWDLSEVDVKSNKDFIKVRCVSTVLTEEGTALLAKFMEGAMQGMGYAAENIECLKGMIVLEVKR